MNIIAIIQARTGSTRYPNKVFAQLSGKPLIWHVINRLRFSKQITKIVLATTTNISDDLLEKWAINNHIDYFRGSEDNVLERYYYAAIKYHADVIVRITADDPFKDPIIIDETINMFLKNDLDFAFNNNPVSFPEGLDVEIFNFESLEMAYNGAQSSYDKEHVTQFFYRNIELFKVENLSYNKNLSYLRWTIDTPKDFEMATKVYEKLYKEGSIFLLEDIIKFLANNPEIAQININEQRSAMYNK